MIKKGDYLYDRLRAEFMCKDGCPRYDEPIVPDPDSYDEAIRVLSCSYEDYLDTTQAICFQNFGLTKCTHPKNPGNLNTEDFVIEDL